MSESDSSEGEPLINTGVIGVFPVRQTIKQSQIIGGEKFQKLKQSLTCPICLRVFMEPVYIKDCSHRFCKQCIEKYIRSQERKSCPSCRKKIGTKRQLRIDENLIFMINLIFGDLTQYLKDEEQQEQLMVEQIRSANIISLKRQKSSKSNDEDKITVHRGQPRKQIQTNSVQQEPQSPQQSTLNIQTQDQSLKQSQKSLQNTQPQIKIETTTYQNVQITPLTVNQKTLQQQQTPLIIPISIKKTDNNDKIITQQNIYHEIRENFKQDVNFDQRNDRHFIHNQQQQYQFYIKPINIMPPYTSSESFRNRNQ